MSPATALSVKGGHSPPSISDLRSLWARLEQVQRQDEEKTILLKEIMTRYEFCNEQYQQEVKERRREHEAILSWQHDKKQVEGSFRNIQVAMLANSFVVVLIDGDGMIFHDNFIQDGEKGGRRAASQLHTCINNYMQSETKDIPIDVRVVCRVYANLRGLAEVLVRSGVTEEVGIVDEFVRGFTRSNPLFDFIDVGPGKDRADEKLIENFKLYTADMHCRQVFFGCSHDNGYARVLEKYSDDAAHLHRITLLEGVPFEKELDMLPFRTKKFLGIFRDTKIMVWNALPAVLPGSNGINVQGHQSSPSGKSYNMISGLPTRFPPAIRLSSDSILLENPIQRKVTPLLPRSPSNSSFASNECPMAAKPAIMNYAAKAALSAPPVSEVPAYKPTNREEVIARNRAGQRVDPPCRDYDKPEVDRIKKIKMCNVHFLRNECPYGTSCMHLHSYKPTKDEIATLRLVARMAPCQYGSGCRDIKCIYGHRCPAPRSDRSVKGTRSCVFGEQFIR